MSSEAADEVTPGSEADDRTPEFDEDAEEVLAELDEARRRLLAATAEGIVVNHAIGLYEFGALHLSSTPPNLASAALAIDAFACLVEGLAGRLGDDEQTLRDALSNIRLAFVQIKGAVAS